LNKGLLVASYYELVEMGFDIYSIIRETLKMDYDYIEGLKEEDAGQVTQWLSIVKQNPDTLRVLLDSDQRIIGYWHFEALKDDVYSKQLKGQLLDKDITKNNLLSLEKPGHYNLYIVAICIKKEYQKGIVFKKLVVSMLRAIEGLKKKGVFIDEISTNAYTPISQKLCRKMGFEYITDHISQGKIYSAKFEDLVKKNTWIEKSKKKD
jgi:hypothetical protein